MNKMLIIMALIIISGCGQQYIKKPYVNNAVSEEQNKKDILDCRFEASKATGYDYIEKAMNKNDIMKACLESKGYTRD